METEKKYNFSKKRFKTKLLEISPFLSVLVSVFIAFGIAKFQLSYSEKSKNEQEKFLKEIHAGLNTTYIGEFPGYIEKIKLLLEEVQTAAIQGNGNDSLYILSDFFAYGVYSCPIEFEEYFQLLTEILNKNKIKIKITCYEESVQRGILVNDKNPPTELKFNREDEGKFFKNKKKFERFMTHVYGKPGYTPKLNKINSIRDEKLKGITAETLTNEQYADVILEIEKYLQTCIKEYLQISIKEEHDENALFSYNSINDSRSFHYWIFNNTAIFSCNYYRNNNGNEFAFRTIEPQFIKFLIEDTY